MSPKDAKLDGAGGGIDENQLRPEKHLKEKLTMDLEMILACAEAMSQCLKMKKAECLKMKKAEGQRLLGNR